MLQQDCIFFLTAKEGNVRDVRWGGMGRGEGGDGMGWDGKGLGGCCFFLVLLFCAFIVVLLGQPRACDITFFQLT